MERARFLKKILMHRFREWAPEEGARTPDGRAGHINWNYDPAGSDMRRGDRTHESLRRQLVPLHWSASRISFVADCRTS
jgi:hypothetical protein